MVLSSRMSNVHRAPYRLSRASLEHFSRDNVLHDLTGAVADFEPHHVAQALLMR
jgi:hypothetical protein